MAYINIPLYVFHQDIPHSYNMTDTTRQHKKMED